MKLIPKSRHDIIIIIVWLIKLDEIEKYDVHFWTVTYKTETTTINGRKNIDIDTHTHQSHELNIFIDLRKCECFVYVCFYLFSTHLFPNAGARNAPEYNRLNGSGHNSRPIAESVSVRHLCAGYSYRCCRMSYCQRQQRRLVAIT